MATSTTRFEQIKEAAAAGSEEDILRFAESQEGGVDGLLDEIFSNIREAFRPERAHGQSADFQYLIEAPGGVRRYYLRVGDGTCEGGRGTVESPRLTTTVALPTFLRLVTGRLNGMQAFLTGKVKLKGNTLYASKFEHWFERPS